MKSSGWWQGENQSINGKFLQNTVVTATHRDYLGYVLLTHKCLGNRKEYHSFFCQKHERKHFSSNSVHFFYLWGFLGVLFVARSHSPDYMSVLEGTLESVVRSLYLKGKMTLTHKDYVCLQGHTGN